LFPSLTSLLLRNANANTDCWKVSNRQGGSAHHVSSS
jgi:hypothetical protein